MVATAMTRDEEQERLAGMQDCINRADVFVEDIMTQIGGLCIQDFDNLNQLCILLSRYKTDDK